jgi:hypothetical protein
VWYHRPPPDDIWSVVLEPTAATLAAYTGGPVPASEILPDGEYRADVYVDGRLVDRVVENNREGWNDTGEPLVAPELGIGGVVGADWRRQDRPFGVEVAYTAPSTPESAPSLVLRRDEGQRPDGDVDDWMDTTLDDWVAQKAGEEVVDGRAEVSDEPQWFLGLPLVRVHEYPGVRAFIGYGPYFSDLADPRAHPDCGGTTFMALVSETPEALTAYESLFLESNGRVIAAVPEQDDMAVEIPEGWAAAEWSAAGTMGSRLAARDCATGANLRVTTAAFEPAASFEQYAQDRIAEYDRQLDGFQLYSERTATVTGGREAVELAYGFVADGTGLTRRELLAVEGTTVHSLTFTTPADLEDDYAADRDSVVQSFRLTRT